MGKIKAYGIKAYATMFAISMVLSICISLVLFNIAVIIISLLGIEL